MKKVMKMILVCSLLFGGNQLSFKSAENSTIVFNVNGGNAGTTPAKIEQEAGTTVILSQIAKPTKSGYIFEGWSYQGAIVESFIMPERDVELLAQWRGEEQRIIFASILETVENMPVEVKQEVGSQIDVTTVATPTHSRYQFAGWYIGETKIETPIIVRAGGIRFEAHWRGSSEVVSFDLAGGKFVTAQDNISKPVGTVVDLMQIESPTKDGYNFIGWHNGKNVVEENFVVLEGGVTLTALWQPRLNNLELTTKQDTISIEATNEKKVDYPKLFGISALDTIDGNITSNIIFADYFVSLDSVGTYFIQATIENSRKEKVTKLLTLEVVDTTAPMITVVEDTVEAIVDAEHVNQLYKLFEIKVNDIVDKEQNIVYFDVGEQFTTNIPGRYPIDIYAIDAAGNEAKKKVTLDIIPLEISGIAFLDTDTNGLNSSVDIAHTNIKLKLVEIGTNAIIDEAVTTTDGNYLLRSSGKYPITAYKVCAEIPQGYLVAIEKTMGNQFGLDNCTKAITVQGKHIEQINIGIAPELEVTIVTDNVILAAGTSHFVGVLVKNGKLVGAKTTDGSVLNGFTQKEGVSLIAYTSGKVELALQFEDSYGRITNLERTIQVTVS